MQGGHPTLKELNSMICLKTGIDNKVLDALSQKNFIIDLFTK